MNIYLVYCWFWFWFEFSLYKLSWLECCIYQVHSSETQSGHSWVSERRCVPSGAHPGGEHGSEALGSHRHTAATEPWRPGPLLPHSTDRLAQTPGSGVWSVLGLAGWEITLSQSQTDHSNHQFNLFKPLEVRMHRFKSVYQQTKPGLWKNRNGIQNLQPTSFFHVFYFFP